MLYWLSLISLFVIDRLTKVYIVNRPSSSAIGDGFLNFYLNKNLAFSLPVPNWLIIFLTLVILAVLLVWLKRLIRNKDIKQWPVGLITIGAVSNLLDRVSYGGVIDLIDLPNFTVFNLSDVYITMGVVWLLFTEFKKRKFAA